MIGLRPYRKKIAVNSRRSTALYSPATAALSGEIMSPITYSGASCSSAASRASRGAAGSNAPKIASTSSECCATEKISAPRVCPFQRATRARPCATSSISTSSGDGSIRSSRRPDSMRCQALTAPVRRTRRGDGNRPNDR